jgi:hypothetical protein
MSGIDLTKDWKAAFATARSTENLDVILGLTHHPDAKVRRRALVELCPCRVERDVDAFWSRVFEMVDDKDAEVRLQVLHTLCDGAPLRLESRVMEAVEFFNRDPDTTVRRAAHKVIASYSRTGKFNIM